MGQTIFSDSNAVRVTTIGDVGVGPARICSVHVLVAGGNGRLTITDGIGGPIALDVDFSATSTHFFDIPDKGIRCEDSMVVTSVANITAVTIGYTGGTRGFVPPTIRNFIDLDPIANAYYVIASPIAFSGDFEIEVDFETTDTGTENVLLGKTGVDRGFVRLLNGIPSINFSQAAGSFTFGSNTFYDGELHTLKIENTSGTIKLFVDGVLQGTTTPADISNTNFNAIGRKSTYGFFNGIIANVNFTDKSGAGDVITTFRLDELTANTENSQQANNAVTYQNIAQDVRDTYIFINGNWVGSELITNGDFTTDSNWIKGAGWSIDTVAGTASTDGTGNNNSISQLNVPLTAGSYELTYTILSISSGQIRPQFAGGGQAIGLPRGAAGTYTEVITTPINLTAFNMMSAGGSGAVATIDNISIKRLIEVAS